VASSSDTLADLYSSHHGWLFGWLRKKMGCRDTAADLSHDTFVRLMAGRELTEIREPRAYLTRIAHSLMVNHVRRKEIERACMEALAALPEQHALDPEARALLLEALVEIDSMLDSLSAKARQAFLLSQLEGLGYAEIAERLGVSVSMLKKYMFQAIRLCMQVQQA
jgi:RNA polymerase sigma-19 factor, ECF subfamily